MSEIWASDWSLCSWSADITLCVWPHMVTVRSQELTIPPETAQWASVTSRVTVTIITTTQAVLTYVSHLRAALHDNTKCSQIFSLQRHSQHLWLVTSAYGGLWREGDWQRPPRPEPEPRHGGDTHLVRAGAGDGAQVGTILFCDNMMIFSSRLSHVLVCVQCLRSLKTLSQCSKWE